MFRRSLAAGLVLTGLVAVLWVAAPVQAHPIHRPANPNTGPVTRATLQFLEHLEFRRNLNKTASGVFGGYSGYSFSESRAAGRR